MSEKPNNGIPVNKKEDIETASKIELIKNLIFGENIQAYESEFEQIRKEMLNKKKALEDLMEAIRTDLRMSIDDVSTDINIRITELEQKMGDRLEHMEEEQLDKEYLGDLLIALGEKVKRK